MHVELRQTWCDGILVARGLCLICTSEEESRLVDENMGTVVDVDGLISISTVECRLSNGYGEHYLYIPAVEQ